MFIDDIHFFLDGNIPDMQNDKKIVDTKLGYARGNMFADEFCPYKNYKVKEIVTNTEEEKLLLSLSEAEFALNDLSLYLDLHPEDKYLFQKYLIEVQNYNKLLDMYQKKYRPLCLNDENQKSYEYYKNPWPWDNNGGVKYV